MNKGNYRHGMRHSNEYAIWCAMLTRCRNKNTKPYERYGGRGIQVCAAWHKFENFYADMGDRPSTDHSLERRDNNKGYSKSNCYWATRVEQGRNKRNNVNITFQNKTQCLAAWAEETHKPIQTLWNRLYVLGWTVEKTLTQ